MRFKAIDRNYFCRWWRYSTGGCGYFKYLSRSRKKITTVGYHRALSAEGTISLNPTIVWHDGNIAPKQVIDQVKKVGIPLREFKGGAGIDSTKLLIMQVAKEFHNETKGKKSVMNSMQICRNLTVSARPIQTIPKY